MEAILNSDLGSCSTGSYTVGVPFTLEVPDSIDPSQSFLINQYSESIRLFQGTAPSGSVEVTSHSLGFIRSSSTALTLLARRPQSVAGAPALK